MEAATATPPRMTADNVGNTTRSKRRDRTRQFFSPFCNDFRPVCEFGWGLAGELPLRGAVPLPAAPFGKVARLAGAFKDAVGMCAGDRSSVSRAGLPVISRLDRTVLHLSPGERQASTEPRGCRAQPKHRTPRPAILRAAVSANLGLTLTLARVTHIKCYHCYLKILLTSEDATGAKWALRAYESYRPGTRARPNV